MNNDLKNFEIPKLKFVEVDILNYSKFINHYSILKNLQKVKQ